MAGLELPNRGGGLPETVVQRAGGAVEAGPGLLRQRLRPNQDALHDLDASSSVALQVPRVPHRGHDPGGRLGAILRGPRENAVEVVGQGYVR